MSTLHQLGPSLFNIGKGVQEKMIINLLDTKYGYKDDELRNLWLKTQDSFLNETKRDSVVYKLNKIYKKKGDSAETFYVAKLKKEYEKSKMENETKKKKIGPGAEPPWSRGITWQKEDYGKFQTIINCFLYATQKNDYFKWALDYSKFEAWTQSLSNMYVLPPTTRETLKEDIAKNNQKFLIEARSGLIEASLNITRQCLASCGKKPVAYENVRCYICGELINNDSGTDPDGSQCEHVVPVTSLAALCGLSGDDYENTINNYFEKKSLEKTAIGTIDVEGTKITRENYDKWRKILIGDPSKNNNNRSATVAFNNDEDTMNNGGGVKNEGVLYRWAHPACNMIKKDYAFLGLDWTPAKDDEEWNEMKKLGFPLLHTPPAAAAAAKADTTSTDEKKVIDDYCDEEGIKYVLNCLSNINKGGGGSLSSAWRKQFFKGKVNQLKGANAEAWVEKRYNAMRDNTMKWAANSILSRDPESGKYNGETKYGIKEDGWPEFRTALCDLSMRILDFRVEEKIKLHYKKFIKKPVNDDDLNAIVEEWRKAEWINLVGSDEIILQDIIQDGLKDSEETGKLKGSISKFLKPFGNISNIPKKSIHVKKPLSRVGISNRKIKKGTTQIEKVFNKQAEGNQTEYNFKVDTNARKVNRNQSSGTLDQPIADIRTYSDYSSHHRGCETQKSRKAVELLKELNDNKLLLQIYFDVFNTENINSNLRINLSSKIAENYRKNFKLSLETFNHEILPGKLIAEIVRKSQGQEVLNDHQRDDTDTETRNVKHKAEKKKKRKSKKKNTRRKKKNTRRKKKNTKRKKKKYKEKK